MGIYIYIYFVCTVGPIYYAPPVIVVGEAALFFPGYEGKFSSRAERFLTRLMMSGYRLNSPKLRPPHVGDDYPTVRGSSRTNVGTRFLHKGGDYTLLRPQSRFGDKLL